MWLEEHFVVHGFVEDLDDVLLPGDASIMPYPFDTGGRVKFAVGAGYAVVNIAYEKTFECSEEFTHGVDCLAAREPAHFAELLAEFVSDDASVSGSPRAHGPSMSVTSRWRPSIRSTNASSKSR